MLQLLSILLSLLFFLFSTLFANGFSFKDDNFVQCLLNNSRQNIQNNVIYSRTSPSYSSILKSTIRNLRFDSSTIHKPQYIITPRHRTHVSAAVICSRRVGYKIRVRSGGHDFEGLSHTAPKQFVLVDLRDLHNIFIDDKKGIAWVEAGATLGQLYYKIGKKNNTLAFPAGICPTVGVGGHFSGGGRGTLMRKYGLSADNIVDAIVVDVNGRILNRKSMGEDLFWAIRGGGAASFAVVLSWKLKLVQVPPKVTVFAILKTLEQGATKLVHKWENIASTMDQDLFIRLLITTVNYSGRSTVRVGFIGLYLGSTEKLIPLMKSTFSELGLQPNDCREMTWLESILYFHWHGKNDPITSLQDRMAYDKTFFKGKSDFVKHPISEKGLESIWRLFLSGNNFSLEWDAAGKKMSEIPANATPYPHRAGNLFTILYLAAWTSRDKREAKEHVNWVNEFYKFMTPFVSKNPRGAYLNYRDLGLGMNEHGNWSYSAAKSSWGSMYFKDNFERLARIKGEVDPKNYFSNEQSIPPLRRRRSSPRVNK